MKSKSTPGPKIVVIGGGIAGLMSAYHILSRIPNVNLTVLEQGDYIPYQYGSTSRSAACSRQQFGCPHNVEMSIYSTRFYEEFPEKFGETMPMFHQKGYLFLYKDEAKWNMAQQQLKEQQACGLKEVRALTPEEVKSRFPFDVGHGLVGATFCPTDGFLDPGIIIPALKAKVEDLGAAIRTHSKVTNLAGNNDVVAAVRIAEETIPADVVVNCTGAWSRRIGKLLGTDIPVAPEKRYLYTAVFRNPKDDFPHEAFQKIPFIACMGDGLRPYLKPEPGKDPHSFTMGCEHPTDPKYNFRDDQQAEVEDGFEANIPDGHHVKSWEELTKWIPFAEKLGFLNKVNGGFYETTPDHNPFIDFDPNYRNVIHCVGFSGHGVMHGPAAGQTVADLIQFGEYRTFPSGKVNLTFRGYLEGKREIEKMKI